MLIWGRKIKKNTRFLFLEEYFGRLENPISKIGDKGDRRKQRIELKQRNRILQHYNKRFIEHLIKNI
jgi:hypothetical protein